ncbi:MAG: hypothetical protein WC508_00765 [Patescibacteria group bacterium]
MDKYKLRQYKKSARHDEDLAIQKGLMNIYKNRDGSLTDISHLEVRRKGLLKVYFISFVAIIALLAAIAWLGFVIFNPNKSFSSKSIKLTINSEQNIASGNEVTYVLEYKNIEKAALDNLEIIFRYPDGFDFISANPMPSNEFNSAWQLGTLAQNGSGRIEIKGKLVGEVGSIKTINATASFQPQNFNSVFKETTSFSSQVTSSILEINIEGPSQLLAQKQATYKITYKNNSDQDLEKVKMLVTYPTNFVFQQANPASTQKPDEARNLNNEWLIDKLEKQQQGTIEITGGYLANDQNPIANFIAQIGFLNKDSGELSIQQEKIITTEIISPSLNINLIINGSNQNQPISFGQTLTYSIDYKNLGQKDLTGVVLSITLDSDVLDWSTLDDKHGGTVEGNKITWTKDQISDLDVVRILAQGVIDFSIKVKDANQVDLKKSSLMVKSKVQATLTKIGDLEAPDLKVDSNEIQNNINTDIDFKVEGRYFDDDNIAVGSGPLPPVVGQKTTFRIFWSLANSLHEVSDVVVTAKLPSGVNWENKYLVKAGTINYNSSDNTVSWKINRIPSNKGYDDVNVWFDLSVTPTKQQVRRLLILTDQTDLVATDKVTKSQITKTGKAITSNLEDDPIASGKGLVIDISN